MLRVCSIEGMERKENFRQEEEENFPALLCVTGSKAGSEETAWAGSDAEMIPEQTHWRIVQQVSIWAVPDHKKQPHYHEEKEAQI